MRQTSRGTWRSVEIILRALCALASVVLSTPTGPAVAESSDADVVFRGTEYTDPRTDVGPGIGVLPARYALVVGVGKYNENSLKLGNLSPQPELDADKVESVLKLAGFDVTKITTAEKQISRNDLLNAIEMLNGKIRSAGPRKPIVAVYFSGHGVSALDDQGSRQQYIVPSDFHPIVSADIPEMAIPLEMLLDRLGAPGPALRIVMIDACRSDLSTTLPKGGTGTGEVRFEPWQRSEIVDRSPKDGAQNDLLLAYATGARDPAVNDGLFADALVDALRRMRATAQETKTGRAASFEELENAVTNAVQGATGNQQHVERVLNAPNFFIYATEYDRNIEIFNWDQAWKIRSKETKEAYQQYWCILNRMKDYFSEYSYLSPLIDLEQNDKYKNSCDKTVLSVSLDPSEKLNDAVSISFHSLLDSAAPSLGKVANGFGAKLDQSSSADRLAYAAYEAPVLSEPDEHAKILGKIAEGDLVQLREGSDAAYIAIRTIDGTSGYVERAALLRGRAAIDETLQFRSDQFKVSPNDLHLKDLLSNVLVTDASVTYPFTDHGVGLTRSQGVAAILAETANGGGSSNILTPRVFSVDANSNEAEQLQENQVRLSLAVAPLSADVRTALGTPLLTGKLTLSDSVDITILADRLKSIGLPQSLALPTRQALANAANGDLGPTIVPRQGAGTSSADRCVAAAQGIPRTGISSKVFIQISEQKQEKDYDTLAAGLRTVGFVVPAIDLQPPVQRNQVRYCPGGRRAEAAEQAAAVLKRCGFPNFSIIPIEDNPNCEKVHDDRVEVWFAQSQGG